MQRLSRILVVAVVVALLTGCAAEPVAPESPSPSFTSEADAFAAAEATYRAYVDALNKVDLADPETFEAVYAWTTGEANADERKNFSQMHADNWQVGGATVVEAVFPSDADTSSVLVCVNVSDVKVFDANGVSQVPADRPVRYELMVSTTPADTPTGLKITLAQAVELDRCA